MFSQCMFEYSFLLQSERQLLAILWLDRGRCRSPIDDTSSASEDPNRQLLITTDQTSPISPADWSPSVTRRRVSELRHLHRLSVLVDRCSLSSSLLKLTPCHSQCLYKPFGQSAYDWWHCWQSSISAENIEHGTPREKNIIRWWNSSCYWVFFAFCANLSMASRSSIVVGVHRGTSARYQHGSRGLPATEHAGVVYVHVIDRCVHCR